MPTIRVNNKIIETESIPCNRDPIFCSICGERIGWINTSIGDIGQYYCDYCSNESDED